MKFKKSIISSIVSSVAVGCVLSAAAQSIPSDGMTFTAAADAPTVQKSTGLYIVQLKGAPAIAKATELGELTPSNPYAVKQGGNQYNGYSAAMKAYTEAMKKRQSEVANEIGQVDILHSYLHTFNGFSAKLSPAQVAALRSHEDVAAVYEDEIYQPETSNTPAFLGLTGPGGQHTLGLKGEDVIVGILDSGIWPENPSFADDGSFSDPSTLGWNGVCDAGDEAGAGENGEDTFQCNNKLIGARYFSAGFSSVYPIQTALGEFISPRDADGHGSHTASTAAGNEGVTAVLSGAEVGTVSGIAPRARIAAYKVCWNSSYVSPAGVNERGCFFSDSMAAIDQAVVDGVDVLNYSIGNSTAINTPVYNASLRAAQAGVFFAASAGNSGPGAATVSNIAPWIATVAASTYDGTSALIGSALKVTVDGQASPALFSVPAGITPAIPAEGLSALVAAAEPILACNSGPLTNPEALEGKIALISRGACNFSEKILNAQAAGAVGVVVYSTDNSPFSMGGSGTGITIPAVMIKNSDGLMLASLLSDGAEVVLEMTNLGLAEEATEIGNIMASFSSRGVNPQSSDIIKPDITAPGVRILAATSTDQLDIPGNVDGESFAYLQGTSMSSPHIAGIAALLMGQHPTWSPAQVKSAIMTTARQDLVKENGSTPADPFDFGAGHADPVPAMDPGLTYDANFGDYLGFLCGQGEATLVTQLAETNCAALEASGFVTDASQLNYPSISIGSLEGVETVFRTVTDMTGNGGSYKIDVDAPVGIVIEASGVDANGNLTGQASIEVPAGGKASYALTFSKRQGFVPNQWVFGSVTLTSASHVVRSPIAVFPQPDAKIDVPESVSLTLNRGRASFPVQMLYSGATSIDYTGLTPGGVVRGTAVNANGGAFDFATIVRQRSFHLFAVPEGTKVARFSLRDALVNVEGADVDLHVWNCIAFSCLPVESSTNAGSNEDIILVNPDPRNGVGGNVYLLAIHAFNAGDAATVNYTVPVWIADGVESTTSIATSTRAINGRFNHVRVTTRGLETGVLHMGAVTFYDENGEAQGTTVIEAVQP